MTQFFYYKSAFGASNLFQVELGNEAIRLGEAPGWQEMAEHLQSGSCDIVIDDPDADVGNAGDAILGNQRFIVVETACSDSRTYDGIIGIREYGRGESDRNSLILGASRQITVELHDLNAITSSRVIPQTNRNAIRPAETVDARMAWVMSSTYMTHVHDNGLIASNTTQMSAADYRGQRIVNVINDCEMAAGFGWNAFVYWDDAAQQASLFFDNANTSTAYSSTLQLSNVYADVDDFTDAGAITFAPFDARLRRDPTDLGDSVYMPYRNGTVFRTRAATQATYGQKDIIAPNSNVGSRARAEAIADGFLFQHRTEEDRITCTVELPPSKVNLIRAGHRIQCKFSHLPGYEDWTWMRVLMRAPGNARPTDDRYTVQLELSPQEQGCSETPALVQTQYAYGVDTPGGAQWERTFTFDNPTGAGNLIVCATMSGSGMGPVVTAPAGWTWAVENMNIAADDSSFILNVFYKRATGEQSVNVQFEATGALTGPTGALAEWSGLTQPVLSGSITSLRQIDLGYADVPDTPYPAGATLVLAIGGFQHGPGSGDDLVAGGTGASLVYPVTSADGLGNPDIGMEHMLRGTADTSGTITDWQFLFTDLAHTLTLGLVFVGDNC